MTYSGGIRLSRRARRHSWVAAPAVTSNAPTEFVANACPASSTRYNSSLIRAALPLPARSESLLNSLDGS